MKKQLLLTIPFIALLATGCGKNTNIKKEFIEKYKNEVSVEVFQNKLIGAGAAYNINVAETVTGDVTSDLVFESREYMYADANYESLEGISFDFGMKSDDQTVAKLDFDNQIMSIVGSTLMETDLPGRKISNFDQVDECVTSDKYFYNLGMYYYDTTTPVVDYYSDYIASDVNDILDSIDDIVYDATNNRLAELELEPTIASRQYYVDGDLFTMVAKFNAPALIFDDMNSIGDAKSIEEIQQFRLSANKISFARYHAMLGADMVSENGMRSRGDQIEAEYASLSREVVTLALPDVANYQF